MEEKIKFVTEDGDEIEFYVIEETKVNNMNYLLVTEGEDEDAEAYIFKDMSSPEDLEASYKIVDDEAELEFMAKIFQELLEDTDIEF
ncbi:MAG: DUF1292 domain-containing protein [Eubacterium sp.]